MARFLNTSRAYAEIEDIACRARRELVLISPYVKIPERFLERLKDAARKDIRMTLVCRKKDLRSQERSALRQVPNLELRYLESLHAKCFYNEQFMVITSLNLYESSQDNREMGVLLSATDDHDLFMEAREEAEFIVRSSPLATDDEAVLQSVKLGVSKRQPDSERKQRHNNEDGLAKSILQVLNTPIFGSKRRGYCIRGGERIPYDPKRPLCTEHFAKWEEYGNPEYRERYCHSCGEPCGTSVKYPICQACHDKGR